MISDDDLPFLKKCNTFQLEICIANFEEAVFHEEAKSFL
jgi:hypothetical protein